MLLGLHEATASKRHRNRTRTKDRPKPGFKGDRNTVYVLIFAGDKFSLYSRPSYPSRKFGLTKFLNCALIRIIVPRLANKEFAKILSGATSHDIAKF